jgi:phosphoribosylglycinamide formyltransferase-1
MTGSSITVGIISYDHAHLKTEQLVNRLLLKRRRPDGCQLTIKVLALPFSPRPARNVLFNHRPDQEKSISTRELARFYQLEFLPCTYDSIPDVADYYLVGGAGIFSAEAIGEKKIINAHPGIIPSARGLDAFKWSILNGVPLGVTLHLIDAQVDAGEMIAVFETPVFPSDTIEVLARRHYELELDVLSESIQVLNQPRFLPTNYPANAPRMRMPFAAEKDMLEKFNEYRLKFSGGWSSWATFTQ